jgi:hypothetical protein
MGMRPAETIAELAGCLGTAEGLKRVTREIGELCERLSARPLECDREELVEINQAISALSAGMFEMDRVVRARIRQLIGDKSHAE